MNFRFCHNNFNVLDLEKSIAFYEKALGLKEVKRKTADRISPESGKLYLFR